MGNGQKGAAVPSLAFPFPSLLLRPEIPVDGAGKDLSLNQTAPDLRVQGAFPYFFIPFLNQTRWRVLKCCLRREIFQVNAWKILPQEELVSPQVNTCLLMISSRRISNTLLDTKVMPVYGLYNPPDRI